MPDSDAAPGFGFAARPGPNPVRRPESEPRGGIARAQTVVKRLAAPAASGQHGDMTGLAVILLIVGIVLLLLGVFVEAVKFLLWLGIVIIIIAVIAWLMRFIRRQT